MYNLISKGVQKGIQHAIKNVTLTATQKTAAQIGSKVAIATATTVAATAVNSKIQNKEAAKIEAKAEESLTAYEAGEIESPMTTEEIAKLSKKGQTKANVTSGVVIGVGSVASTLVDVALKAL